LQGAWITGDNGAGLGEKNRRGRGHCLGLLADLSFVSRGGVIPERGGVNIIKLEVKTQKGSVTFLSVLVDFQAVRHAVPRDGGERRKDAPVG